MSVNHICTHSQQGSTFLHLYFILREGSVANFLRSLCPWPPKLCALVHTYIPTILQREEQVFMVEISQADISPTGLKWTQTCDDCFLRNLRPRITSLKSTGIFQSLNLSERQSSTGRFSSACRLGEFRTSCSMNVWKYNLPPLELTHN